MSRPRAPFAALRPSTAVAGLYAVAVLVWITVDDLLPGGRWLAVHLLTLGSLTTVVVAFSRHFSATLTRRAQVERPWLVWVLTAGVVAVLVGVVVGWPWWVALGATVATAAVGVSWWDVRRMRHAALDARFAWVVRIYERAHGAFLHGALLGALMGTGLVTGAWYGAARLAHLHVTVLGWGGLTLLATLVFFGPTVLRARIADGAETVARRWLPRSATSLTVAVVLLVLTGAGGTSAAVARVLAAAALAVFTAGAVAVCVPVMGVARTSGRSVSGSLLVAACCWLLAALAVDVAVVATGSWELLDAVGVAVLAGALGQSVIAALGYVAPMLTGTTARRREELRTALERAPRLRPLLSNIGVALAVVAAVLGVRAGDAGAAVAWAGWGLLAAVLVTQLLTAVARRPTASRVGDG